MTAIPTTQQAPIKVSAAYGRLYVSGPGHAVALRIKGAALNSRRGCVELSLTLESLRGLRRLYGYSKEQFVRYCTTEVLAWGRAAWRDEQKVAELHAKLAVGWRLQLDWPDTATSYRPAFDHQKVMASLACTIDGSGFFCQMGTGKTRAALESMRYRMHEGHVGRMFVWCPKSVQGVWVTQMSEFAPDLVPLELNGKIVDRRRMIAELRDAPANVVAIGHYGILHLVQETLLALSDLKVGHVLDEAHKIKNPNAKVTQAVMELARRAAWRLVMTGTPMANTVEDLWSQYYVIDWGVTFGANFVQFRRDWLDENPWTFKLTPKTGALDEIGRRLRKRAVRYTKEECLDLPPKVYEVEEVEMSDEQQRAYEEMEANLVTWLAESAPSADGDEDVDDDRTEVTAANQLARLLRLTQITSGHAGTSDGTIVRFGENPKLDRLEELVRENIGEQQIIVWCRYREDVAAIAARLADLRPVIVQGQPRDMEPVDAERMFQSGRARLLIGNPASGGLGLNLQAGSLAFYYSQGYSLIEREQSEDRCHRAGSERHNRVTYVDVLMKQRNGQQTVDHIIRTALREKKSMAAVVVDLRSHVEGRAA